MLHTQSRFFRISWWLPWGTFSLPFLVSNSPAYLRRRWVILQQSSPVCLGSSLPTLIRGFSVECSLSNDTCTVAVSFSFYIAWNSSHQQVCLRAARWPSTEQMLLNFILESPAGFLLRLVVFKKPNLSEGRRWEHEMRGWMGCTPLEPPHPFDYSIYYTDASLGAG